MNTSVISYKLDNSKKVVFAYGSTSGSTVMRTRATVYRVNHFSENGYSTTFFLSEKEAKEYANALYGSTL